MGRTASHGSGVPGEYTFPTPPPSPHGSVRVRGPIHRGSPVRGGSQTEARDTLSMSGTPPPAHANCWLRAECSCLIWLACFCVRTHVHAHSLTLSACDVNGSACRCACACARIFYFFFTLARIRRNVKFRSHWLELAKTYKRFSHWLASNPQTCKSFPVLGQIHRNDKLFSHWLKLANNHKQYINSNPQKFQLITLLQLTQHANNIYIYIYIYIASNSQE